MTTGIESMRFGQVFHAANQRIKLHFRQHCEICFPFGRGTAMEKKKNNKCEKKMFDIEMLGN